MPFSNAKKQGEAAARTALKEGKNPYLPVLDSMPEIKESVGETYIGILEIPVSYVVGNKEASRNNAFALVNVAQTQLGKAEAQLNYSEQWYTDFVTDCARLANQFKDLR